MAKTWNRTYEAPRDKVFATAVHAVSQCGYIVENAIPDAGVLRFKSARGQVAGEIPFTATFAEADGGTSMILVCEKDLISGWYVQRKVSARFLAALDSQV